METKTKRTGLNSAPSGDAAAGAWRGSDLQPESDMRLTYDRMTAYADPASGRETLYRLRAYQSECGLHVVAVATEVPENQGPRVTELDADGPCGYGPAAGFVDSICELVVTGGVDSFFLFFEVPAGGAVPGESRFYFHYADKWHDVAHEMDVLRERMHAAGRRFCRVSRRVVNWFLSTRLNYEGCPIPVLHGRPS